MPELLLNITAISLRTGIKPDTLRKWEQRYGVLRPVRTAGGQRRYSETDVQRVEWIRDRIAGGWRVGEASRMLERSDSTALDDPTELRDALIGAIRDVDVNAMSDVLDQAFAVLPTTQVLNCVVSPALQWTGDAWQSGDLSIAQEHVVSAKVRSHLGALLVKRSGNVKGIAVLACGPGEYHDIGLLMLAISLHADGWQVEYLGANLPLDAALEFANRVNATMLCITTALETSVERLRESLASVERVDRIEIVLGGAAATPAIAKECGVTYAGGTLDEIVAQLRRFART